MLECNSDELIDECPICKANKKHEGEWPQAGTHVFTVIYECNTEIDYPIGHDGADYGVTCDGKIKRFVMPVLHSSKRKGII